MNKKIAFKVEISEEALLEVQKNLGIAGKAAAVHTVLENAITGCTWKIPQLSVTQLSNETEVIE